MEEMQAQNDNLGKIFEQLAQTVERMDITLHAPVRERQLEGRGSNIQQTMRSSISMQQAIRGMGRSSIVE